MQQPKKNLNSFGFLMIGLLAIQYLTGMFANLFVEFPEEKNPKKLWETAWSSMPLAAHIVLGFALIIVAAALLTSAIKQKNKPWIIASSIGAVSVLAAIVTGGTFVSSQKEILSYLMSASFLVAITAYGWGIYSSK